MPSPIAPAPSPMPSPMAPHPVTESFPKPSNPPNIIPMNIHSMGPKPPK